MSSATAAALDLDLPSWIDTITAGHALNEHHLPDSVQAGCMSECPMASACGNIQQDSSLLAALSAKAVSLTVFEISDFALQGTAMHTASQEQHVTAVASWQGAFLLASKAQHGVLVAISSTAHMQGHCS